MTLLDPMAYNPRVNWMRCRPYLLVTLVLAGCQTNGDNSVIYVAPPEVNARADGEARGSAFSQARACGADPRKVTALAAQEPPLSWATPDLEAIYRKAFNLRLNAVITTTSPQICAATRRNPSLASLFPAPTREERAARLAEEQATAERARKLSAGIQQEQSNRRAVAQCEYESIITTAGMRPTFLGIEQSAKQNQLMRLCLEARGILH